MTALVVGTFIFVNSPVGEVKLGPFLVRLSYFFVQKTNNLTTFCINTVMLGGIL